MSCASAQAWKLRNPELAAASRRKSNLKGKYGLTVEEFDSMLAVQGGLCLVCGEPFGSTRNTQVDHDHQTGVVRGILCQRCNVFVGYVEKNIGSLEVALQYLGISQGLSTSPTRCVDTPRRT